MFPASRRPQLLLALSMRRLGATLFNSTTPSSSSPTAAAAVTDAMKEYLQLHDIVVRGSNGETFPPMTSFDDTPFPPFIVDALYAEGFTAPTPIQAQSWPIALAGKDMVSVARTGSGKTCAFLLPGFLKALQNGANAQAQGGHHMIGRPPQTLILSPTRELAQQIVGEAQKFSRSSRLNIVALYGGTPMGPQFRQLSRGVDLVVGTPGRCNDLAEMGALDLSSVNYLVLDEADRMLDMGFEPQIRTLIQRCYSQRQNLFFTATWPKEIAQLAHDYLTNPVSVHIGGADTLNANKAIHQSIHMVKEFEKSNRLEELMDSLIPAPTTGDSPPLTLAQRRRRSPKTLIFVREIVNCDFITSDLALLGFQVASMHGGKEQYERTRTLERFRSGDIRVLVATDVAARGIDIKDIKVVINYDFPEGKGSAVEDYVHRIGRTARGERTGIAHSFFTPKNAPYAPQLVELLRRSGHVSLLSLFSPSPLVPISSFLSLSLSSLLVMLQEVPPQLLTFASQYKEQEKKPKRDGKPFRSCSLMI
jgi:ATP-dependent RNA helicase DDX5/DBP2